MTIRSLLVLAFFGALFFASRGEAHAALKVCDRSPQPATVALAVVEPTATGTVTQVRGWWQIDAGACATLIDDPLQPTSLYYLYGKSPQYFWAGNQKQSSRDTQFCISSQNGFTYVDRPAAACNAADDEMAAFIYEPVRAPDWTITLETPVQ